MLSISSIVSTLKEQLNGRQAGETLVEVLAGIALTGVIGVVFLQAMGTSNHCVALIDESNAGESLARAQMEYIKGQDYSDDVWNYALTTSERDPSQQPSWWDDDNPPLLEDDYTEYYIVVTAADFDADGDGSLEIPGDDDSVRKITINVYNHQNELLLTLTVVKTNR